MKGKLLRLRRIRTALMELVDGEPPGKIRELLLEMELACLDAQDEVYRLIHEGDN